MPLHDSHAIGDDGPLPESVSTGVTFEEGSALAAILRPTPDPSFLLAVAIAATINAQTTPGEEQTEAAVSAVAAYCTAAGLDTRTETADRILTAIETAKRSPEYDGGPRDVAVAHFWAQPDPRDLTARYRDPRGVLLRPLMHRHQFRLVPATGRVRLTVRQATRYGLLTRIGGAA